jgi:hypothetical protein
MGLVTSLTGGRPGMVAGATGAVSVVLTNLVAEFGIGHLFYACMLAGLLQVVFGLLRLGEAIRLIPHPVMVVRTWRRLHVATIAFGLTNRLVVSIRAFAMALG